MKRILALILAVLVFIPALTCFAFAGGTPEIEPVAEKSQQGTNIASEATVEHTGKVTGKYDPEKLIDGDRTTGTNTGRTENYTMALVFDKAYYFTNVVFYLNGEGTLPDGSSVAENYNIGEVTIRLYKAGEEVLSQTIDTSSLQEIVIEAELAADRVEIYRDQSHLSTSARGKDFLREIETYMIEKEFCNVEKSNIAAEALIYADGTNEGDYCDSWWAWNPKVLVDGNKELGTHSPKGWNYSIFVDFTRDYLISELILTVNGKGTLIGNAQELKEVVMNVSQIRVVLFNMEGEQVYNSGAISVDSTEVKVDPFVEACRVKIEIANGKGDGSEYLWEIETYVEEGSHIFEETDAKNPTCNRPGYIEYSCHCGKVIKKSVPATGFHVYDDGVVTREPTETENGVLTKTCYACKETKNYDIPATSHKWDNGVTTEPDCETEGSTVYTCQGGCGTDNCDATYVTDIVDAFGHDWDDGVVTKKASVTQFGQKKFTCMRDGCGKIEYRNTRKLQYTDATTQFDFDSISDYEVIYEKNEGKNPDEIVTKYNESPNAIYKLQDPENLLDDDMMTYWHGTTGTTYTINLDREYIFTKGTLYASGNSVTLMVEWIDAAGEVSATYTTQWNTIENGADKSNPISVGMTDPISSGAKAKSIRITITGAKWENGYALALHGLEFVVHDCKVDKTDEIRSGADYKAPTCTEDGYCNAKCPVCENLVKVTIDKTEGHTVGNVTTDVAPTCSDAGYGHGTCSECSQTVNNIPIPALGTHVYDKEIVYMQATCGSVGISQLVCAGCGRVGSQSPIPATNNHICEWTEEYAPTYTDDGKLVFICTGCGLPSTEEGISEKPIDKKELTRDFLTFVGYSIRTTDYAGIRLTYKIDMEKLAEIEYECDVRIITYVTNAEGVTKSVESYGKYSEDRYAETGEFSVVIKPSSYYDEYEIRTVVRLMNFRGVEYVDFDLGALSTDANGKISLCEVAEYVLDTKTDLGTNEKKFYQEIVAGK